MLPKSNNQSEQINYINPNWRTEQLAKLSTLQNSDVIDKILTIRAELINNQSYLKTSEITNEESKVLEPYLAGYTKSELAGLKLKTLHTICLTYLINLQIVEAARVREINKKIDTINPSDQIWNDKKLTIESSISDQNLFSKIKVLETLGIKLDQEMESFVWYYTKSNIENSSESLEFRLNQNSIINDSVALSLKQYSFAKKQSMQIKLSKILKLDTFNAVILVKKVEALLELDQVEDIESLLLESDNYAELQSTIDQAVENYFMVTKPKSFYEKIYKGLKL